jgi:hypothetical protein
MPGRPSAAWWVTLGGEHAPDRVLSLVIGGQQPYQMDPDTALRRLITESLAASRAFTRTRLEALEPRILKLAPSVETLDAPPQAAVTSKMQATVTGPPPIRTSAMLHRALRASKDLSRPQVSHRSTAVGDKTERAQRPQRRR